MAEGILATLTPDRIRCRVKAQTREDVVRLTGELLERSGLTEPRYTAAMNRIIDELGPYVVIAPGVALPHAHPHQGVRRAGLALLTLDAPVVFGHTENDPVWLAIGVAGSDNDVHERALADIAYVLATPGTLEAIRNAADADAVLAAIGQAVQAGVQPAEPMTE